MVRKKIKETLSRAHTIRAAQVLPPEDEPAALPDLEIPFYEAHRRYLRGVVHDLLLHNTAKDGTVRDCVHYTLRGITEGSCTGRCLHEGSLVVMSPKDFNELRRLVEDLSGSRPLNSPKGE